MTRFYLPSRESISKYKVSYYAIKLKASEGRAARCCATFFPKKPKHERPKQHDFTANNNRLAAALSPRKLSLLASAGLICQLASSGGGSGVFGALPSALNGFEDFGAKLSAILNSTADANTNEEGGLRMRFGAVIPGDSAAESVLTLGIYNFLNYYNFAIVARLLLTWFPNPPQVLVGPLSAICDPYLNLFRGIIPPLGQLDLSPIISLGLLNFITGATAALPCELPAED
eukprot:jgi/Bigna1/55751/estExt_Genewise1Plus.C_690020